MDYGYARVSTDLQSASAQSDELVRLGVPVENIFVDEGFTGKNRNRPGLEKLLLVLRAGDTLTVTRLDRLGRSIIDLHEIAKSLETKGVTLNIGGSKHDPSSPEGGLLFGMFALFAAFEAALISERTRIAMKKARAEGKLKGRKPKLSPAQEKHLCDLYVAGTHSTRELTELFGVGRGTVYRALERGGVEAHR